MSKTSPPILFFAAGLGTRMTPLTDICPKPLIEVGGKPLLQHAMEPATDAGLSTQIVNIHYKAQMIRDHLNDHNVLFSDETDKLLETGGGLKKAIHLVDAPVFITMNTDAVWKGPNPVEFLLNRWSDDMDALLLLIRPENARGHKGNGDFIAHGDARLSRGQGAIYSGLQIIKTDILNTIEKDVFSLNLVWDRLLDRRSLFGVHYDGNWCDVGQPESITIAEALLNV